MRSDSGLGEEDLLAVAAHEIRAPLTRLTLRLGLAERLLAADADSDAGRQEQLLALLRGCHEQARRIDELMATLLDVTRLRAEPLGQRPEDLDLAALVRDVVSWHAAELRDAGSRVELRGEEALRGRWDRARLEAVLTNLLGNAIKYGGGRPIEISVAPDGGRAALTVRDHGDGIEEAERARIFECFGRGARHRQHPGLGLGLYIVRTLLHSMGGTIDVRSAPGSGASFRVELPLPATP